MRALRLRIVLPLLALVLIQPGSFVAASVKSASVFRVAAGKVDITPDPKAHTVWLAGYGPKGRKATGVLHPLYARAIVVSDGKKTVALVSMDSIGIFAQDVEDIRRRLGWTGGDHYLMVSAIHSHSAPDTLGLWGPLPGISGVDQRHYARVKDAVASLVRELAAHLQDARIVAARKDVDPRGLCRDDRDPVVIDPELEALRFESRSGKPIATVVRWSCHPVALGAANLEIAPDYPGPLCDRIESSGGGACVFFNGEIGGHLITDTDRSLGVERQREDTRRIGEKVAEIAIEALKRSPQRLADGPIDFESREVRVPVQNSRYLLALPSLAWGHRIYDAQGRRLGKGRLWYLMLRHLIAYPLPDRLEPWVDTEVAVMKLGPIKVLAIPGELLPELAIGGFDGRYRFGAPLVRPDNPNPPALAQAPKGPYLRQRMNAEYGLIIGLANDELGYIIPGYDFKVNPDRLMEPEPPGDHYEETNSIGPRATDIVFDAAAQLLSK